MVLTGDVAEFPLSELLFFLSSKQRTGRLTLSRADTTMTLTLLQGRLVAGQASQRDQRLGQRLVADGTLTDARLQHALTRQRAQAGTTPLGALLVELGYVEHAVVQRVLHEQIADCLVQVLRDPAGTFTFHAGSVDAAGIAVDLSIEREVLDALRRVDELASSQVEAGAAGEVALCPDLTPEVVHVNEWTSGPVEVSAVAFSPERTPDVLAPATVGHGSLIDALLGEATMVDGIMLVTGWARARVIIELLRLQDPRVAITGAVVGAGQTGRIAA